jgi:hypothetical protein
MAPEIKSWTEGRCTTRDGGWIGWLDVAQAQGEARKRGTAIIFTLNGHSYSIGTKGAPIPLPPSID